MTKCNKCNVELDTISDVCPLCNSEIKNKDTSSYPFIKNNLTKSSLMKKIFFINCIICIIIILINYFCTPNIKWSIFVVIQLILTYFIFCKILTGRNKIIRLLFMLNFIICIISIFWDYYVGFSGWSINYVFPSLCISYGIFMIILRFINYFAFKENTSYIYLNVCIAFIPLLLVKLEMITFPLLAIISFAMGVINILILIIFGWSNFKEDIRKKLHM